MSAPSPSQELLAGRRALDGLPGVELLEDWHWLPAHGKWSLLIRLTIPEASGLVPQSTDWFFVVEPSYPLGHIWVNPAKTASLTVTFPHQRINLPGDPDDPWRNGNLCVTTEARALSRYVLNLEPWSAHRRLKWYVQRALSWLQAAAANQLLRAGEPFEMPEFPVRSDVDFLVAFNEDEQTFKTWQEIPNQFGYFQYSEPTAIRQAVLVQRFITTKRKVLLEAAWGGSYKAPASQAQEGVWLRLPALPVLEPWQAPTTWGELESACDAQGFQLLPLLEHVSHRVRDGKARLAVLGFPVPRTAGDEPVQMHWQAFMLPGLAHGDAHPNGFRASKDSQWRLDRRGALAPNASLEWVKSVNWGPREISARGRLPARVCEANIVVIGSGALGSVTVEMLARAGVYKLVIIDNERIEMGNLVRHTLTMNNLGLPKAETVANRLGTVSPNIQVDAYSGDFPPQAEEARDRLENCDVIIDSTGSDEVIEALAGLTWPDPKLMISVSLSIGAKREYVFVAYERTFPAAEFHRWIDPQLRQDAAEWQDKGLPWEGVGCWNPVTPGRVDDVWLLAAAAIKEIESAVIDPPDGHRSCVIAQGETERGFGGLEKR